MNLLRHFSCCWANFHCCKWPNSEEINQIYGHTAHNPKTYLKRSRKLCTNICISISQSIIYWHRVVGQYRSCFNLCYQHAIYKQCQLVIELIKNTHVNQRNNFLIIIWTEYLTFIAAYNIL